MTTMQNTMGQFDSVRGQRLKSAAASKWVLLLCLPGAAPLAAQQRNDLNVAVTFDDVPGVAVSSCTPSSAQALNERLLAKLERHRIPAAALVTTGRARCAGDRLASIVRLWTAAGHEIGSHTHTHLDINTTSLATYLADVDKADGRLSDITSSSVRYFRHPFLHAGDTRAKKDALDEHLRRRGYTIAVVTIDNQEWVFAEAYATAKASKDTARIARILPAYYAHIDSSFAYYEQLTQRLFNRQIPQVLLLHANEINADHLDDVVRVIRRRGYRFVRMSEALRDSAYQQPDSYIGRSGPSWLQRWAQAAGLSYAREPREPEWLRP